jgi:DNA polymerase elongation subunit (family B)
MIIDVENCGEFLRASHFTEEGVVGFIDVPVPEEERFVWQKCSANDRERDPEWKTWKGEPIKKVRTQKYDKYRIAQILDESDREITSPLWEYQEPRKYFVDIEVEITDVMGDALDTSTAKNKVISIGIATDRNKIIVMGIRPLTQEQQNSIYEKINNYFASTGDNWSFRYQHFESEYDMMFTFFKEVGSKMGVITGWNWMGYDWPYLITRAKRLGIDPKMMSVSNYVVGKAQTPAHMLMFDYLDIYKKWDRVIKIKESNRLDYVADKAVGFKKIEYDGTLRDLYESDFENFIYYNAVDCALVHYIDKKLKTQQTFFKIAMTGGVEINRCLSPVWSTEVMMLRYFTKRKQVFVSERSEETHLKFAGGYVMDPIVGLHEWVACYDFASLYPNAIVQWGISPETYKGKDRVNPDPNWIKTASGAYFGGDDEEAILRTIVKDLYARRRSTKDKMLGLQIKIDELEKKLEKLEKEQ